MGQDFGEGVGEKAEERREEEEEGSLSLPVPAKVTEAKQHGEKNEKEE